MNKGFEKIKAEFEENPLQVIGVGAMAAMAAGKLLESLAKYRGRRTWDREVARRERAQYEGRRR